jgi:ADP-heptose:LPS heptosyltransferase
MKRLFLILLIFSLIIILGLRIKDDWSRYRILKNEVNELITKKIRLLEEEKRLERLKEEGSKAEVLEREAREMLGLKKEGENVVLILPLNNQVQNKELPRSAWQNLVSRFAQNNETTTPGIVLPEHLKFLIAQIAHIWYNFKDFFAK